MNRFTFSELGDHIQDYSDTEKFMLAFDDKKFGQCEETFTEGPQVSGFLSPFSHFFWISSLGSPMLQIVSSVWWCLGQSFHLYFTNDCKGLSSVEICTCLGLQCLSCIEDASYTII